MLDAADAAVDELGDEDEPQNGRPDGEGGAPSPESGRENDFQILLGSREVILSVKIPFHIGSG